MNHIEQANPRKLRTLYSTSFLFAVAIAIVTYAESSFLETVVGERNVGLVFAASYAVALVLIVRLDHILFRIGKRNAVVAFFLVAAASIATLALSASAVVILPLFVAFIAAQMAAWVGLDILIETFSSDGLTGRIRGTQLTIMNAGWVIAPSFAGFALDTFGFTPLFVVSAACLFLVACIVVLGFDARVRKERLRNHPVRATIRSILRHPSLSRIFTISFVLQFFYAWMVIYTPLHLRAMGLDWMEIGQIFSVMLLPFILFEYPAGWLADRFFGEKEILLLGLAIITVSTGALFFVTTPTLWVWALLLFATRVGASLIEIMRDTYFFKQIGPGDTHLIEFFRNTGPLAYMTAPLLASAILGFFPMQTLFLVLGVILAMGFVVATRIPDTR